MRKGSKHSSESIEKNRQKHMGKKDTKETKEKKRISHLGEKNAFYGKHHSEETLKKITGRPLSKEHRDKLSEVKKGKTPQNIDILKTSRVGSTNSEEHKKRVSEALTGIVRSEETKQKISENRSGINCGPDNAAWTGGTSFAPYCHKFNEPRKRAVRNFFGNRCICCGKHKDENIIAGRVGNQPQPRELSVHHIHHNKNEGCNGVPFNLVPMCHECHNDELSHQEEYKKYINDTLEIGFEMGIWSREQYVREVMYPE